MKNIFMAVRLDERNKEEWYTRKVFKNEEDASQYVKRKKAVYKKNYPYLDAENWRISNVDVHESFSDTEWHKELEIVLSIKDLSIKDVVWRTYETNEICHKCDEGVVQVRGAGVSDIMECFIYIEMRLPYDAPEILTEELKSLIATKAQKARDGFFGKNEAEHLREKCAPFTGTILPNRKKWIENAATYMTAINVSILIFFLIQMFR